MEKKYIFDDNCIRVHELIGRKVIVTIRSLGNHRRRENKGVQPNLGLAAQGITGRTR